MRFLYGVLVFSLLVALTGCTTATVQPHVIAVSEPVTQAAVDYLQARKSMEDPTVDSLQFLLDQPQPDGGQIVIVSYKVGPANVAGWNGKRLVVLLKLDGANKLAGGGAVGDVALQDSAPVTVAGTWLGHPEQADYVFYGSISIPGVQMIEVTEQDGSVTDVAVEGKSAFYSARHYSVRPGQGWGPRVPASLRAFDAKGKVVYEKHFSQDR